MSSRRGRSSRRSGHPARAAGRAPAPVKARTVKRARPGAAKPRAVAPARRRAGGGSRIGAAITRRASGALKAALEWSPGSLRRAALPTIELERVDLAWAVGTWAISVALFATVLSPHPGLSDASESVAGVASVGILHAPGYPSYVLAARLFTWIIPFGDLAFRVGLFSLLCASLSVALVQLLARRFGAPRWAASLGALTLAFGAGYWFYAGFSKHDQFSGLCLLSALYLLLAWEARPATWRLVGVGAALAIGLGASWPLMVMLVPCLLYVLVRARRLLTVKAFGLGTIVGAVLLVGIYGFVMVRASENPALNWGDATSFGRLVSLIERSDFSPVAQGTSTSVQAPSSFRGATSTPASRRLTAARTAGVLPVAAATGGKASSGLAAYARMFWRELGVLGFLLALWGAIASLTWRRRTISIPLLLVFGVNLVGAGLTVAPSATSYDVDLVEEGFILGCYFVLACWVAIGATDLVARARRIPLRTPGRSWGRWLAPGLAAVLGAATLVPLAIAGWPVAHRSDNAYADAYAETTFSELPHRAALFVWGSDLNFPLTYRQVVYHQRPDVVVVSIGGLRFDWYRRQITRQLGAPLGLYTNDTGGIVNVLRTVERARPTFIDQEAAQNLRGLIGYRSDGLVAQVQPGTRATTSSPARLVQTIEAAARRAGMPSSDWQVWPNSYLASADYASAAVAAARFACQAQSYVVMRQALAGALEITPQNSSARNDLARGLPSPGEKVNCG